MYTVKTKILQLTKVPIVPAAFITLSESSKVSMLVKSVKILEVSPHLFAVRDITRKQPFSLSARVPRIYAAFPATLKLFGNRKRINMDVYINLKLLAPSSIHNCSIFTARNEVAGR